MRQSAQNNSSHAVSGHPLVASVPRLTIFEEAVARLLDRYLVRGSAIGSSLHLAFNADAEGVGRFLVSKVFALSSSLIVGVVHHPRGLGFTRRSGPRALANRGHGYTGDRLAKLNTDGVEHPLAISGLRRSITIAQWPGDRSRMCPFICVSSWPDSEPRYAPGALLRANHRREVAGGPSRLICP
jgi:hypothetical protein